MTFPIDQLRAAEQALSHAEGPFRLFAVVLRSGAPDRWDVLVSAPWIEADKGAALQAITAELQRRLDRQDLVRLSAVVTIDPERASLARIGREFNVEHGAREIYRREFLGREISRGVVITAKAPGVSAAARF